MFPSPDLTPELNLIDGRMKFDEEEESAVRQMFRVSPSSDWIYWKHIGFSSTERQHFGHIQRVKDTQDSIRGAESI